MQLQGFSFKSIVIRVTLFKRIYDVFCELSGKTTQILNMLGNILKGRFLLKNDGKKLYKNIFGGNCEFLNTNNLDINLITCIYVVLLIKIKKTGC
jgi:hypothetical protein